MMVLKERFEELLETPFKIKELRSSSVIGAKSDHLLGSCMSACPGHQPLL